MSAGSELHESLQREEEVAGPSERSFGLTFATVFALLAGLLLWRGSGWWLAAIGLAAVFLAGAVWAPGRLRGLNRLWLQFGLALHAIVSPLVMGGLFYLVITPFGVAARLLGKDFLHLRFEPQAATYWIERRPPGPEPKTMRNQF
ncbi:MAG: SxtJ family membrane protein [Dongiaceae bacterium]